MVKAKCEFYFPLLPRNTEIFNQLYFFQGNCLLVAISENCFCRWNKSECSKLIAFLISLIKKCIHQKLTYPMKKIGTKHFKSNWNWFLSPIDIFAFCTTSHPLALPPCKNGPFVWCLVFLFRVPTLLSTGVCQQAPCKLLLFVWQHRSFHTRWMTSSKIEN